MSHDPNNPVPESTPSDPDFSLVSDDLPEDPLPDRPPATGWHPGRRPIEEREIELHRGRRFLAYGSIVALWVTIGLVTLRWIVAPIDLQPIAQAVLLPLVAFVGPIIGFYFRDPRN